MLELYLSLTYYNLKCYSWQYFYLTKFKPENNERNQHFGISNLWQWVGWRFIGQITSPPLVAHTGVNTQYHNSMKWWKNNSKNKLVISTVVSIAMIELYICYRPCWCLPLFNINHWRLLAGIIQHHSALSAGSWSSSASCLFHYWLLYSVFREVAGRYVISCSWTYVCISFSFSYRIVIVEFSDVVEPRRG